MKNWIKGVGLSFLLVGGFASAEQTPETLATEKFEKLLRMSVLSVADSPVDGVLQVMTERGLFYVTEDAKFLLHGRIYNLDEGMRNETEEALSVVRVAGLEKFKDDVIEFKAKDEKYAITIFTDITCGYCRKLHNQIDDYNAKGITVRYLAFPRGGLGSQSYDDLVSIWCATDPQAAMTNAKAGGSVSSKECETSIAEQFAFAQQVGISATPSMIMADGSLEPGYRPPEQLLQVLAAL